MPGPLHSQPSTGADARASRTFGMVGTFPPTACGIATFSAALSTGLIAEGHSSREIAALLTISVKTVDRHRENILAKLGMRDRTELTRYAVRVGLIEP